MRLSRFFCCLAAWLALCAPLWAAAPDKLFHLTILHTNDIHAHIDQFNDLGQSCSEEDIQKNACFGGYPRIASAVEAARKKGGNVLLLDAGDQFTGTLFFNVLKGAPSQACLNALRYTAMTLGNHEFDDGPAVLADTLLKGLNVPVLAANMDAEREPALKGRTRPWMVLTVGGRKVGLVGLANEHTPRMSSPGPDVAFSDSAQALRKAVQELSAQGADIVVAVTHVGYDHDRKLAASVDGVDVIVGGHSHTLLSNTDAKAAGPYPTVEQSPSGKPVLVVQAKAWGKYLGDLEVDFDAKGVPIAWRGEPLLLDGSRPQDPAMLAKVKAWEEELKPYMSHVVGKLTDPLRPNCRGGECALGNVMADALRAAAKDQGVRAAFINGGAARAGLKAGDVNVGDLLTVYPFQDHVATFELSGADLLAVLEHGVSLSDKPDASGTGRFLQVSGLNFSFDPRKPVGQRVVNASILGKDGGMEPVRPEAVYPLASCGYLLKGGDGYTVLKDKAKRVYAFGKPISDALIDYFSTHSPMSPKAEGRIVRLGNALAQ